MLAEILLSGYLLTSDQHKIYYDHYKNNHKEVVIIAHGFYNSKQSALLKELAQSLTDEYDVIAFDFRGHGKSEGAFCWTSKEYLDLSAVLEYAHSKYNKIGVIGFSLGAATSIITATKTDLIDSLVCISAPTDFDKIDYHWWELDVENDLVYGFIGKGGKGKGVKPGPFWEEKEKPIDLVKKIKVPILYIHGDSDWVIKPWHSKELYKNTSSEKELMIIEKGPHAEYLIRKNKDKVIQSIRQWFEKTLK